MPNLTAYLSGRVVDYQITVYALPYNPVTGQQEIVYLSNRGFRTAAGDPLGGYRWVPGALMGAPTIEQTMFGRSGDVNASPLPTYGQIQIDSHAVDIDHLHWDGRPISIAVGNPGDGHFGSRVIFNGVAGQPTWGSVIKIPLRGHEAMARDKSVPVQWFGETFNGVPVDADVIGTPIPIGIGLCTGRYPVTWINRSYLIAALHDSYAIADEVWDYGSGNWGSLVFDGDYPDGPSLMAADVKPGFYARCITAGLIRLGALLQSSDIRASWEGQNGPAVTRTHAEIFGWAAGQMGLPVDSASLAQHAADCPEPAGLVITGERDGWDVLREIAASCASYVAQSGTGVIALRRLVDADPGSVTHNLTLHHTELRRMPSQPPFYRGSLTWAHAYEGEQSVMDWERPATMTAHAGAREDSGRVLLQSLAGDRDAAVTRWADYLSANRVIWRATLEWFGQDYQLGQTVTVNGILMLIVGVRHDYPIPQGRQRTHAIPVTLMLQEVRA